MTAQGPHEGGARPGRRAVLTGGLAAVGGALVALGGSAAISRLEDPADGGGPTPVASDALGTATVAFRGPRQAGVGTPPQAFATLVGLDLVPGTDRDAVVRLMRIWTDDAERLMAGRAPLADTEPELAARPASLTVTVGFGVGLLAAAGAAGAAPAWLGPLPPFAVDRLEPAWCDGDVVLQVCADDPVAVAHAVRVLVRGARTFVTTRWVQSGFRHAAGVHAPGTTMRNLMGQVDGTRNLAPGVDDALIWCHDGPDWLVGGTGMVVRRIAMDLDAWEGVDRAAREAAVGRRLADGAPLTGAREHDEPDLDAVDALGLPVISDVAHIRRARTDDPAHRFLRRVYSYDDGPGASSGLLFITFQADLARQLVPVQERLAEADLLNLWTTPVGSAVFAVPPGCGPGEYLGQALLES